MKMNTLNMPEKMIRSKRQPIDFSLLGEGTGTGEGLTLPALPHLRFGSILLPFDFSDASMALLRPLVDLAERTGATLHILHVRKSSAPNSLDEAGEIPCPEDLSRDACEAMMKQWIKQIVRSRISTRIIIRTGEAPDEILSCAGRIGADLIVMSTQVYSRLGQVLLRSTTERVTRKAPCPVLVIPIDTVRRLGLAYDEFPPQAWKTILLPVDFSRAARVALRHAVALAMANQARLRMLHVVAGDLAFTGDARLRGEQRLGEWIRAELHWPVEYSSAVWVGIPPLHAILLEAKRSAVDAMVLPTRTEVWSKRLHLRSVTDSILRYAPCPIVAVHERIHSCME
ncbi:MAG TPA: universal stress protein [Candidatus Paceibacterota bacterium]|nr:universal stress protein [Verrucomicrobiota bacterium]HRZ99506.1 universal stress protein [Candidatus Paceibacterota bacterium]